MHTLYNAVAELDRPAKNVSDDEVDKLMDFASVYSPAVGASPHGRLEMTVTIPAMTLRQAVHTATALLEDAGAAIAAGVSSIEVMSTADFDDRVGMERLPSLIGSAEAAELLGVSRQRVAQLVDSGQLPAEPVGRNLILARASVEAFAARDRGPGRPRRA